MNPKPVRLGNADEQSESPGPLQVLLKLWVAKGRIAGIGNSPHSERWPGSNPGYSDIQVPEQQRKKFTLAADLQFPVSVFEMCPNSVVGDGQREPDIFRGMSPQE